MLIIEVYIHYVIFKVPDTQNLTICCVQICMYVHMNIYDKQLYPQTVEGTQEELHNFLFLKVHGGNAYTCYEIILYSFIFIIVFHNKSKFNKEGLKQKIK